MQVKQKIIKEYSILRVIAILLVVMGHSAYLTIGTKYGGVNFGEVFTPIGKTYGVIDYILNVIYNFHMPLFVFLSGSLYYFSTVKNREGIYMERVSGG